MTNRNRTKSKHVLLAKLVCVINTYILTDLAPKLTIPDQGFQKLEHKQDIHTHTQRERERERERLTDRQTRPNVTSRGSTSPPHSSCGFLAVYKSNLRRSLEIAQYANTSDATCMLTVEQNSSRSRRGGGQGARSHSTHASKVRRLMLVLTCVR